MPTAALSALWLKGQVESTVTGTTWRLPRQHHRAAPPRRPATAAESAAPTARRDVTREPSVARASIHGAQRPWHRHNRLERCDATTEKSVSLPHHAASCPRRGARPDHLPDAGEEPALDLRLRSDHLCSHQQLETLRYEASHRHQRLAPHRSGCPTPDRTGRCRLTLPDNAHASCHTRPPPQDVTPERIAPQRATLQPIRSRRRRTGCTECPACL